MNYYLISEILANQLLAYLVKRPYEDVNSFILQLQQLQKVTINQEKDNQNNKSLEKEKDKMISKNIDKQ